METENKQPVNKNKTNMVYSAIEKKKYFYTKFKRK